MRDATGGLTTNRIEAFSDGVFAIAITLLVLNVHVPDASSEAALLHDLRGQWLIYLSYLLSVAVVGVYWVAHHGLFSYIRRADRTLFWLNILFLACVAFLPFPTALLGQYGRYRSAVIVYGLALAATGLVLDGMRAYATRGRRLVDPNLDEGVVRAGMRRNLTGPAAYLLAVLISLIPLHIGGFDGRACAIAIYVLAPLLYILPSRIDRYWAGGHGGAPRHEGRGGAAGSAP
jgi:uncharacterized membrane protein